MMHRFASLILLLAAFSSSAFAQSPPKTEFRGAWIATVINLDWPPREGLTNGQYQEDLSELMEGLSSVGINAVFFQVRSECDAMYPSPYEPWSYWLTGTQGRGPLPSWDPLQYAIEEAHSRGMALHAWLNPFRCEREVGAYDLAAGHPTTLHPDWVLQLEHDDEPGRFMKILDPGKPQVRAYVSAIIGDIVRRYDVDGIHFDDYFYPYPPFGVGGEDLFTYAAFGTQFDNISDWRRDNINRFVAEVDSSIKSIDPDVVFGVSPFGIWRSGTPDGIVGLSGADVIYADALAWLEAGSIDYLAPQLYWPFGGEQDFASLSFWWSGVAQGRHIYPGLAAYRADSATEHNPERLYSDSEIPEQIRHSRANTAIQGNILFRAQNLIEQNTSALSDSLRTDVYRYRALLPSMPWRDLFPPDAPENLVAVRQGDQISLEWDPAIFGFVFPRYYAIYRVESRARPVQQADRLAVTADARNLVGMTYEPEFTEWLEPGGAPVHYVVTALSRNHAESLPSRSSTIDVALGSEEQPAALALADPPFPNPFSEQMTMRVQPGSTVRIYDALGRRLLDRRMDSRSTFIWDGRTASGRSTPAGLYIVSIENGSQRASYPATRLR